MKDAKKVVEFFRSQLQQVGCVKLLGMKVLLPNESNSDNVCAYISRKYIQYDAHKRSDQEPIISIWHKHLEPRVDSKVASVEELAEELVELFRCQKKEYGNLELLSIKAMFPRGADSDKISEYIVEKYPEYKAHAKNQGEYPIVAIGFR